MHNFPPWFYDSLPREGSNELFITSPGLEMKVDAQGGLKPFRGETTVFLLPDEVKKHLSDVQGRLYAEVPEMLCAERLRQEHFHMTLHSFWDMASTESRQQAAYKHEELFRALDEIRADFPGEIMMRTVCPLSMANTSVVMGLAAADEANGRILREIYRRISSFYPRPYALTPHVTLAYFRPGRYPEHVWKRLKTVFIAENIAFPISTHKLCFQSFENMNDYRKLY